MVTGQQVELYSKFKADMKGCEVHENPAKLWLRCPSSVGNALYYKCSILALQTIYSITSKSCFAFVWVFGGIPRAWYYEPNSDEVTKNLFVREKDHFALHLV